MRSIAGPPIPKRAGSRTRSAGAGAGRESLRRGPSPSARGCQGGTTRPSARRCRRVSRSLRRRALGAHPEDMLPPLSVCVFDQQPAVDARWRAHAQTAMEGRERSRYAIPTGAQSAAKRQTGAVAAASAAGHECDAARLRDGPPGPFPTRHAQPRVGAHGGSEKAAPEGVALGFSVGPQEAIRHGSAPPRRRSIPRPAPCDRATLG